MNNKFFTRGRIAITVILAGVIALIIYNFSASFVDTENYTSNFYATWLSLFPPIIAIVLALITKEVYSSLFVGVVSGGLIYANFNLEFAFNTMLFGVDEEGGAAGLVPKISDVWNTGILVFLVLLGIIVALMSKAGGSVAFGKWASTHIKTRMGAQLATIALGVLIFIDDYFNCLTVGSVMRPVTDSHKISRAKLAYLIDATAAPVCIIAPISSWAAAVTSSVPDDADINGFQTFLLTIPYNFYALLTIVMMLYLVIRGLDFGPMKKNEINAINGDLFTVKSNETSAAYDGVQTKGRVIDLILPVAVLIVFCVIGMIYTGGFFDGESFIDAFANSDASVGLVVGAFATLIFTFFFYMYRDVISFNDFMKCIPQGFTAMVAPILILALAWTLSGMTGLLGGKVFVANLVSGWAAGFKALLPAVIFLVALGLAFSTGTSWGTFGILIPIVLGVFPSGEMMILSIAACLAGAVCGDHCSPISDTTIMASAGARSDHINHVSTQLPYALTTAAVSAVSYVIAGFVQNVWVSLPVAIALMIITLFVIEKIVGKKA